MTFILVGTLYVSIDGVLWDMVEWFGVMLVVGSGILEGSVRRWIGRSKRLSGPKSGRRGRRGGC